MIRYRPLSRLGDCRQASWSRSRSRSRSHPPRYTRIDVWHDTGADATVAACETRRTRGGSKVKAPGGGGLDGACRASYPCTALVLTQECSW